MAETTAAPAAPVPASPSAPAPGAPAAAPAAPITPSEAGRTLAQLRSQHREALSKPPAPAPAQDTPPEAKPPAPAADDDEIATLIAEDRRLKTLSKELETRAAAVKEHEQYIPSVKAAREALAKGDYIAALSAVFPGEDITSDLFWALSKHVSEQTGAPEVDIDQLVEKKLTERQAREQQEREKAQQEARQKVAEARDSMDRHLGVGFGANLLKQVRTVHVAGREVPSEQAPPEVMANIVTAYGDYVKAALSEYERDAAKYPAIGKFRPPLGKVVEHLERMRREKGTPPSTTAVLQAMEDEIAADIRGTPYAAPSAPAARPSPTVHSGWQRDAGGAPPAADEPKGVDAKRAAIRARLAQPRSA
jgi:hypothetical protein